MQLLLDAPPESVWGLFSSRQRGRGKLISGSISKYEKKYWLARECEDGDFIAKEIELDGLKSSLDAVHIKRNLFLQRFTPEVELYVERVQPVLRQLEEHLCKGEEHLAADELYSAGVEFSCALTIDAEHITANFGLGFVYIAMGDFRRARELFKKLCSIEGEYADSHKHLFNNFAIRLRKAGLFDDAMAYYEKAKDIDRDNDEHILINMAVAMLHKGELTNSLMALSRALELNPDNEIADKFLDYLKKMMLERKAIPEWGN